MTVRTTRTPLPHAPACEHDRPCAYVSLQDAACRSRILTVLEDLGWRVASRPTGFHLLQEIADMIDGDPAWRAPALIVIDVRSRGCAGTTIAAGLRELGISIPIVLVGAPSEVLPLASDPLLEVVEHARAESAVVRLATRLAGAPISPRVQDGHPAHATT